MPKEPTSAGVTPDDAAVGQFVWFTLHEVGHAVFDIFDVPIFGNEEDAADNFATYIMLQNQMSEARRLIGGAAWAWRSYIGDYRRDPVVQVRLESFASDHGLPKSVSIISCAWPSAPTRCCLTIWPGAVICLRHGLHDANVSIKRWPMRSKRKSTRISIGKSQTR